MNAIGLPTPSEIKLWSTPKLDEEKKCQEALQITITKTKNNIDEILR